jgi:hypothetical protein
MNTTYTAAKLSSTLSVTIKLEALKRITYVEVAIKIPPLVVFVKNDKQVANTTVKSAIRPNRAFIVPT